MPEEIFIIIIVGIIAGTLSGIVAQFFGYLKTKAPKTSSEASMTTSELEAMIQKWIGEATRPLVSRLDKIEEHLEPLQVAGPSNEKSILDDMDAYEAKEEDVLASRQKTKS